MRGLRRSPSTSRRILAGVIFSLVVLVLASCTEEGNTTKTDKTSSGGGFENTATMKTSPSTTKSPKDEQDNDTPEGTLKEMTEAPEVVVRLEGAPKTSFRGLCSVGGSDEVLGGQVPKRFTFDLQGGELTCRIQKKGSVGGELKIILLDGDQTRSVQSTRTSGGTINLSYSSE